MNLLSSKPKAVSIVELVIAMTIFLVLITSGLTMVSQVSKAAKKVEMEEYLTTEGQALLEKIAREIQVSAIDYEEYYSRYVLNASTYGEYYGEYHKQFFNPGYNYSTPSANPQEGPETGGYGAYCNDGITAYPGPSTTSAIVPCYPFLDTFDFEVGAHPFTGDPSNSPPNPETANALCEGASSNCSTQLLLHEVDELYLINKAGNRKIIIAKENGGTLADAVSVVILSGTDTNGDSIYETWRCASRFTCTTDMRPVVTDLTNGDRTDNNFIAYSPKNLSIEWIKFYISPIEDPFKGYNEISTAVFQSVQQQPRVTIVMNAKYQLYDNAGNPVAFTRTNDYIGNPPEITLQTTVGTGVTNEIPAYKFP